MVSAPRHLVIRTASCIAVVALLAMALVIPAGAAPSAAAPAPATPPARPSELGLAPPVAGPASAHAAAANAGLAGAAAAPADAPVGALVVGGTPVRGTAPPVVRIVTPDDTLGSCGGTLIGPYAVLTAAHCVTSVWEDGETGETFWFPDSPVSVNVLVGTTVRGGSGGLRASVLGIHIHPEYDPWTLTGDAAVLMLATPQKGPYAALASEPQALAAGASAHAFGWGMTAGYVSPLRLFSAELHGVGAEDCQSALDAAVLDDPDLPWSLSATMLCAGDGELDAGRTVCFGDSGGPLFVGTGTAAVQVGIASWTMDGCATALPAVFTDVGAIRDFIDPFAAASAGILIDVSKATWVDFANIEVGAGGPCLVRFGWWYADPSCPYLIAVRGQSAMIWTTPVPSTTKLEVRTQAFTEDQLPLSPEVKLTASPKAGATSKLTPDPKPCKAATVGCLDDVTIMRLKGDPAFAWETLYDGAGDQTVCSFFPAYAEAYCEGPRAIALRGNAVAFFGPVPSLWTAGGGWDDWGPVVLTNTLPVTSKPAVGTVGDVTLKPVLTTAFYGLEVKAPKPTDFGFTVFPADLGAWLQDCKVYTTVMYCAGPWDGSPGMIEGGTGRLFLPVADLIGKVDVEALTWNGFTTQSAMAEGVGLTAGKVTVVTLKWGMPVASA